MSYAKNSSVRHTTIDGEDCILNITVTAGLDTVERSVRSRFGNKKVLDLVLDEYQ
jgi:hypothetical protein